MNKTMKIILLISVCCLLIALPVFAQEPCVKDRDICPPGTLDTLEKLAGAIAEFIYNLGLYAVAPLMVVIGGFQIMTAGSKSEQVTTGRNTILYALAGVSILLIASGLVSLIKDILGVTP